MNNSLPPEVRFWTKVRRSPGCWEWIGSHNKSGYGQFGFSFARSVSAYRFAYEYVRGKVPAGLELDHLCRNPGCVNPYHLEAVTPYVNTMRGESPFAKKARQTHCKNGHPLSGDNLKVYIRKTNGRKIRLCNICRKETERRRAPRPRWKPKAKGPEPIPGEMEV